MIKPEYRCKCGVLKDKRSLTCSICAKRGYPRGEKETWSFRFPKEQVVAVVNNSFTFTEAAKLLQCGRLFIAKLVKLYDLDISHMRPAKGRATTANHVFNKGTKRRNGTVKKYVLTNNIFKYECNSCGIGPEWNGRPLVIQLEHKDGDGTNNEKDNLEFLCPNCHSQTDTFCGKNI